MVGEAKVVVVVPAYNAATTLELSVSKSDRTVMDDIIVVDDAGADDAVKRTRQTGLFVRKHGRNQGWG